MYTVKRAVIRSAVTTAGKYHFIKFTGECYGDICKNDPKPGKCA